MRLPLLLTLVVLPLTSVQSYPVDSTVLKSGVMQSVAVSVKLSAKPLSTRVQQQTITSHQQVALIRHRRQHDVNHKKRHKKINLFRNRQAYQGMHFFCFLALLKNKRR